MYGGEGAFWMGGAVMWGGYSVWGGRGVCDVWGGVGGGSVLYVEGVGQKGSVGGSAVYVGLWGGGGSVLWGVFVLCGDPGGGLWNVWGGLCAVGGGWGLSAVCGDLSAGEGGGLGGLCAAEGVLRGLSAVCGVGGVSLCWGGPGGGLSAGGALGGLCVSSTAALPAQICTDIDECNDGNNGGCDPNAVCTNTEVGAAQ